MTGNVGRIEVAEALGHVDSSATVVVRSPRACSVRSIRADNESIETTWHQCAQIGSKNVYSLTKVSAAVKEL